MSGTTRRWPRIQRSRLARLALAIVVTVPLVYSAVYMWVMWDPTNTVDKMPVAIVNLDRPSGTGAEQVNAGAEVTQNLISTRALAFEQVSAQRAAKGLASGHYYFTITIPQNFSSKLAAIGSTTAAPALMTVTYNDNNTIKASSIGDAAMSQINAAVLRGVAGTTVGTMVSDVGQLGSGLKQAADGSGQLADGTRQLRQGVDELAASVTNEYAPGVREATQGSRQLTVGMNQLQGGTKQLGDGAKQIADGIDQLSGMVDAPALLAQINQIRSALPPGSGVDDVVAALKGLVDLRDGSRQLANELNNPTADYRSGVDQLVTGSSQLSDGMNQLDTGTGQLVDGVQQLQDGIHQVDDGSTQLNSGLADGARQIPDLGNDEKQQSLANLLATPVGSRSINLANAQFNGPGGAPTFLIFGCWLVVIVTFMCFRGHRYLTGTDAPPSLRVVLRRSLAVCAISLAAMAVVATVVWNVLTPSPNPSSMVEVVAIMAVATLMNVALTSVLFTLFGYVAGALTALAAMMLQLFSYGGVWMVQTLPAPFQWLNPISPMTYVRNGLIAAFNGVGGFWPALVIMAVIAAAAGAVNFVVVDRAHKRHQGGVRADEPLAEPDDVDGFASAVG